jgi:Glycine zipper 2TM domain
MSTAYPTSRSAEASASRLEAFEMKNQTNRFATPLARVTAKGILFATALALLAGCVEAPPPRTVRTVPPPPPPRPNTEVYAYPTQGQTPEQTDRDRYDCHEWAVKQSNFDPSAPGIPPHDRVVVASGPPPGTNTAIGAVAGAVLGAVIAGPRNSGFGAVAGGITGAAIGSTGDAANAAARQQQVQAIRAQDARQAAAMDQKASNYRRAISACLEGRGYSVK